MAIIRVDSKAAFQRGLNRRLKVSDSDTIAQFAHHFFADLSLGDLRQRHWEDVTASVCSSWKFYEGFNGTSPQIRIVPGRGNYLVIEVASRHKPFLLESIRIELNQSELVLSDVQQCLMGVVRNDQRLSIDDEIDVNESLIRLEIGSSGAPANLADRIARVMGLVRQVVEDFPSMRGQLKAWSSVIHQYPQENESCELLDWFSLNNFTFLGYEEFKPIKNGQAEVQPESRLGLARPDKSAD
ncbi:MAG TPA: hypothetical protein EYQ00_03610, partial [Dehalococcoidia bacterium]|nr:hypothetical protein [Dehalococcoidia bacterium]